MVRVFQQYVSGRTMALMFVEAILLALSLVIAATARFANTPAELWAYFRAPQFPRQLVTVVAVFQLCFYFNDLYNLRLPRRRHEQFISIESSLGSACIVLSALYWAMPGLLMGRGVLIIGVALASALTVLNRVMFERAWASSASEKVLIIGNGELAHSVAREIRHRRDLNISVVKLLEPGSDLNGASQNSAVNRVIIALEDQRGALPLPELIRLRVSGVPVEDAHSIMAALSGRIYLSLVRPSWFLFSDGFHRSRTTLALKRALDLSFALAGLIASLPLMLLIALAVRLDSKGPIIYRQKRVGLAGGGFDVLKFRSMRADAEKNGAQWAAQNDSRITRIGGVLRKYRLDELPQFLNVIRGEMSFVGPRPERPEFVAELRKEIAYYDERHSVRPGITGWAQVRYPYGATKEDALRKLEYDLFYLKNMSVLFDCSIILRTIRIMLSGFGAR